MDENREMQKIEGDEWKLEVWQRKLVYSRVERERHGDCKMPCEETAAMTEQGIVTRMEVGTARESATTVRRGHHYCARL